MEPTYAGRLIDLIFASFCTDAETAVFRVGFYPTALKGYISETMRCIKLIPNRDIGWGCRCATSWCDLDLTFGLVVVTLSLKILSGLYLRKHKV